MSSHGESALPLLRGTPGVRDSKATQALPKVNCIIPPIGPNHRAVKEQDRRYMWGKVTQGQSESAAYGPGACISCSPSFGKAPRVLGFAYCVFISRSMVMHLEVAGGLVRATVDKKP